MNTVEVKQVDVYGEDAQLLINELSECLMRLLGHRGTKHVNLDDFMEEHSAFFVGYEEGIPMCCAGLVFYAEGVGEIKRVYARKNNSGIAGRLMAEIEKWARHRGYNKLILECREPNKHALEFYRRVGFTPCGKFAPYEDEDDAVCMEKYM